MSRALVLFEDARWADLRPLTDTLPTPALAFGASTLGERLRSRLGLPLIAIEARAGALEAWRDRSAPALPPGANDEVLVANATAASIKVVAAATLSEGGLVAVNLKVAERFVDAFGNIAKQGNTMILPGNAADIAGLVATAMQVVKKS